MPYIYSNKIHIYHIGLNIISKCNYYPKLILAYHPLEFHNVCALINRTRDLVPYHHHTTFINIKLAKNCIYATTTHGFEKQYSQGSFDSQFSPFRASIRICYIVFGRAQVFDGFLNIL